MKILNLSTIIIVLGLTSCKSLKPLENKVTPQISTRPTAAWNKAQDQALEEHFKYGRGLAKALSEFVKKNGKLPRSLMELPSMKVLPGPPLVSGAPFNEPGIWLLNPEVADKPLKAPPPVEIVAFTTNRYPLVYAPRSGGLRLVIRSDWEVMASGEYIFLEMIYPQLEGYLK